MRIATKWKVGTEGKNFWTKTKCEEAGLSVGRIKPPVGLEDCPRGDLERLMHSSLIVVTCRSDRVTQHINPIRACQSFFISLAARNGINGRQVGHL